MARGEIKNLYFSDGVTVDQATAADYVNPVLEGANVSDFIDFDHIATPATPDAGKLRVYAKSDDSLYAKTPAGVEVPIGSGAGGSGEKNYVDNPSGGSAVTGWVDSGGDLTITRLTAPGDAASLPRENTTGTGLAIVAGVSIAVNDHVYYDFDLDDIDVNRKLNIKWAQKLVSTYAAGDLEVYIAAQSDRLIAIATPTITDIPASDYDFNANGFDTNTTTAVSLVIRNVSLAAGEGIVISDVIVGPGQIIPVPAVGGIETYTPTTQGFGTPTVVSMQLERSTNFLRGIVRFAPSTTSASEARFGLPSGLTVGYTNTPSAAVVGRWYRNTSSATTVKAGTLHVLEGQTYLRFGFDDYTTAQSPTTSRNGDAVSSGTDNIFLEFSVPIAEWAGAPNYAGSNVVEYASNSSATSSDDLTSFAYGPSGSPIPSITASGVATFATKRVRFPTAFQAGEYPIVLIQTAGVGPFVPVGQNKLYMNFQRQNTGAGARFYGIGVETVNSTDVDILFGNAGSINNSTTFGGTGQNYPATASDRYLVVKERAGSASGFGTATSTSMGLVKYNYQELDPSSSGTISAAQPAMHIARTNQQVSLTFNSLGHASAATANTAAGFLPTEYRPPFTVVVVSSFTSAQVMATTIGSDGSITWNYRDWAGSTTNRTSTPAGTVSWTVDN